MRRTLPRWILKLRLRNHDTAFDFKSLTPEIIDKMALSFTGDPGCEFGGGVSCHGNTAGGVTPPPGTNNGFPTQRLYGWQRVGFHHHGAGPVFRQ
jgi:hypothetical protein